MQRTIKHKRVIAVCMLCLVARPCSLRAAAKITDAQWQQLTNDKAFAYKNEIEAAVPAKPVRSGFLENMVNALLQFFGNGPGKVLLWAAVLTIVVFIVYKLLFSKDSILFGKSSKKMAGETAGTNDTEDLATTDWEAMLNKAAAGNDYRNAVRYSYMWLLQLLQRKEQISYGGDKTNFDYYNELKDAPYRQAFREISRQYEYAWYGHFTLSDTAYKQYAASFNELKKQIGS